MGSRRSSNWIAVFALLTATLASLGPHLAMFGYDLAGAHPPAALLFVCPLHRLSSEKAPALVIRAPRLGASH
ncbi:MAG: hypothetical protein JOZ73_03560 [Solirubrobacterales bacterium]|nr:hypothetical protein [Solirubrobacterales bacterium]